MNCAIAPYFSNGSSPNFPEPMPRQDRSSPVILAVEIVPACSDGRDSRGMTMQPAVCILDFDGSLLCQKELLMHPGAGVYALAEWGPRVRLACGFRRFHRLMAAVDSMLRKNPEPSIVFAGSGDFHHVSLGLAGRVRRPFNLLVLDAHPDWMRGIPFLHCGTWLSHAARLPNLETVYHVGGCTDFDDRWRWLAPWRLLRAGRIKVIAAARRFAGGRWGTVDHQVLRASAGEAASTERIETLFRDVQADLAARPLYISIDKDVLCADEVVSNWDCGRLTSAEVIAVVRNFLTARRRAPGRGGHCRRLVARPHARASGGRIASLRTPGHDGSA